MPQWDFLDFVTRHAATYSGFRLLMETEATGLLVEQGRVTELTLAGRVVPATLTVAADGRRSTVRRAARLPVRAYDAPMDVLWFRLSRRESEVASTAGRVAPGRVLIRIDRGDYWQVGYVIDKGGYERLRADGLDAFRYDLAALEPALADRVDELSSWADVSVLEVRVDRLRRWHRPGLLCVGDAAHAMSPVGGVGINLAVQDAVAAANLVVRPLRTGTLSERDLARVQRRRALPTAVTQAGQRAIHRRIVGPLLAGGAPPAPVRILERFPRLQAIPAYLLAVGIRPEHVRT
jgi:2-polyprenyl-6-methoxyphenol hydroxylase-like FAD-dependent oxidoreductase